MPKRSQLFVLPLAEATRPGFLPVFSVVFLAVYLPFSWILFRAGPWDPKRLLWLKSWPALPGFLVQSLDIFEGKPVWSSYAAMGLVTFLVFILLFRLGRASRPALVLAFLLGACFSGWNAWLAFQAY